MPQEKTIKTIVLAYSGGRDTTAALRWLQEEYDCEVVTFTADLGQGGLEKAREIAQRMGVQRMYVEDLREPFVAEYVYPMMRANTLYEGEAMLGTAIARPLIARRMAEIAAEVGADAIAHGATGKGNDQLRMEIGAWAWQSDLRVIAPWRQWPFRSREDLAAYCRKHDIGGGEVDVGPDYSMDANLLHCSYEGAYLEDLSMAPREDMWQMTVSPQQAPDAPEELQLEYRRGDVVAVNSRALSPAGVLTELNRIGGAHGIGRIDMVENRYVGMKSRGCYESPGGAILLRGHRAMESLTLDREAVQCKDELMPRYAAMIYRGFWWSPERRMMQAAVDASQENVNGTVCLKLYKGNIIVGARSAGESSLYNASLASFEDDGGVYDHQDATGFIRLNALRFRTSTPGGTSVPQ